MSDFESMDRLDHATGGDWDGPQPSGRRRRASDSPYPSDETSQVVAQMPDLGAPAVEMPRQRRRRSQERSLRRRPKATPSARWIVGGGLLGAVVLIALVMSLFNRGKDHATVATDDTSRQAAIEDYDPQYDFSPTEAAPSFDYSQLGSSAGDMTLETTPSPSHPSTRPSGNGSGGPGWGYSEGAIADAAGRSAQGRSNTPPGQANGSIPWDSFGAAMSGSNDGDAGRVHPAPAAGGDTAQAWSAQAPGHYHPEQGGYAAHNEQDLQYAPAPNHYDRRSADRAYPQGDNGTGSSPYYGQFAGDNGTSTDPMTGSGPESTAYAGEYAPHHQPYAAPPSDAYGQAAGGYAAEPQHHAYEGHSSGPAVYDAYNARHSQEERSWGHSRQGDAAGAYSQQPYTEPGAYATPNGYDAAAYSPYPSTEPQEVPATTPNAYADYGRSSGWNQTSDEPGAYDSRVGGHAYDWQTPSDASRGGAGYGDYPPATTDHRPRTDVASRPDEYRRPHTAQWDTRSPYGGDVAPGRSSAYPETYPPAHQPAGGYETRPEPATPYGQYNGSGYGASAAPEPDTAAFTGGISPAGAYNASAARTPRYQ